MKYLILAILLLIVRATDCAADEFSDRIAALEAKNAAKKVDPFAHANHKVVQDCGCQMGARCTCGETCPCQPPTEPVRAMADPLIQASDGRLYRLSEWGATGPWGQIIGPYYQTDAGGCSNGSCSPASSGRFGRRR